jgi:hypothetical protein
MTSTISSEELVKLDGRGRVRTLVERRDAFVDEFEKSGVSGPQFARLAGIKYSTFIGWVQKRRKKRRALSTRVSPGPGMKDPSVGGAPIRLFEAVVEGSGNDARKSSGLPGLVIELPGGSRMVVESPVQMQMAAELVAMIAKRVQARC